LVSIGHNYKHHQLLKEARVFALAKNRDAFGNQVHALVRIGR